MLGRNSLAVTSIAASLLVCAASAGAAPIVSNEGGDSNGVIDSLRSITTIGSTIDPVNGDRNPYGLTIAPASGGAIAAGDLVTCNFNDALKIQGLGTSIEVLKPVAHSQP